MNIECIREALEQARHELTTLNNLWVSDKPPHTWQTDTSQSIQAIDLALTELDDNGSQPS